MRRIASISLVLTGTLVAVLGGTPASRLSAQEATPGAALGATAAGVLQDTAGKTIGTAFLAERGDGTVAIFVTTLGLTPGDHGIHAHEAGACDPSGEKPFTSAGGHFNPTGAEHGAHAGDLGNITVDAEGLGMAQLSTDRFTLSSGATPLLDADGAALVIHANRDENDPEGKSFGGRIACGILTMTVAGTPTP
ncbi:MAG: superoxide dismutase family protein [Chloroflexia bacterium]|nr:superoxide dismutase family protein [Chloroflexia bacterium]